ncbi:MAG: helix-turn-helix domain-containing protein, partial [Pseudonocardiaceae bacterium]
MHTVGYHLLTEDAMTGSSPTVRRRQLGMELRRLRELAGKSQDDAAEWLGIDPTAVSRMESGKRRVTVSHLRSYLQLYGVGSPAADYLLQLCRESAQRGWYVSYGKTVPDWFRDYLGMETA